MATNKKVEVDWSNLPKELLPLIVNHLDATIDIIRLRSTCTSWRYATPLPSPSSSRALFVPQTLIPHTNFTLRLQTKIYRLQPSSTSAPDSSRKGWIIMVADPKSLPVCLLDPFTNEPLSKTHPSSDSTPAKLLNLLNFRFIQLVEAYSLRYETHDEHDSELRVFMRPPVLKVVLFPSLTFPSKSSRMVFALCEDGKLRVSNIGDEGWTVLDDGNYTCLDEVILHMGQLYVVDNLGTIFWVDCSSLKLVQFSPMLCIYGKKKRLVECNGSLYVVDIYIERECPAKGMHWEDIVDVKVFRLDKEGARWLDVKNLDDVVFVLGKNSNFSLSAKDYHGCEGNCVYFYSSGRVRAFSLESSKFSLNPSLFEPKFSYKGTRQRKRKKCEGYSSALNLEGGSVLHPLIMKQVRNVSLGFY